MSKSGSSGSSGSGFGSGAWDAFRNQNGKNRQEQAGRLFAESKLGKSIYGPAGHPRRAHYCLSHGYLRQAAFANPSGYIHSLSSPDRARKFLETAFARVASDCRKPDERPDFKATDVKARMIVIKGWPTLLIEMPTPRSRTEMFYSAFVLFLETSREARKEPDFATKKADGRYFTLEKGFDVETNLPIGVFCEWEKDKHRYHEEGPSSSLETFVAYIEKMIPVGSSWGGITKIGTDKTAETEEL